MKKSKLNFETVWRRCTTLNADLSVLKSALICGAHSKVCFVVIVLALLVTTSFKMDGLASETSVFNNEKIKVRLL